MVSIVETYPSIDAKAWEEAWIRLKRVWIKAERDSIPCVAAYSLFTAKYVTMHHSSSCWLSLFLFLSLRSTLKEVVLTLYTFLPVYSPAMISVYWYKFLRWKKAGLSVRERKTHSFRPLAWVQRHQDQILRPWCYGMRNFSRNGIRKTWLCVYQCPYEAK